MYLKISLLISITLWAMLLTAQKVNNIEFVLIPEGKFVPGSLNNDKDEKNSRKIKISHFYISKLEITNEQYCIFLNQTKQKNKINSYINLNGKWRNFEQPLYEKSDSFFVKKTYENYPVTFVSWYGANAYCEFYGYKLPSEIQWEYAASAAGEEKYIFSGSENADQVALYAQNSGLTPKKTATKEPNKLGVYDMSGSISEWCADWYDENQYEKMKRKDPKGPHSGLFKVHRGGSWANSEQILRITNRRASKPTTTNATIGFRVITDSL